ncbi:hypothetical protein PQX77_015514 [Marasmius sp. AFHP31]|nr:hypothetical protein PQX77_015514 [Marasmius sp. AFHP31]
MGASTTAEKENIANDNTNQHGMPINAELTSYFRKVPLPYDPDKKEAAMLLANATMKAHLHSETSILTTIFALLFWDIIFADVPGAFEAKFQAGPLDLVEDSFYHARQDLFDRGRDTLCVGILTFLSMTADLQLFVSVVPQE